jgi:hypothetical protein
MSESRDHAGDLSFTRDLPLARAAAAFASERHAGQRRQSDGADFVLHPIEVAALLERSGYPDHVVAAAVLHDVLEDTDAERADLEARFGLDPWGDRSIAGRGEAHPVPTVARHARAGDPGSRLVEALRFEIEAIERLPPATTGPARRPAQ